MCLRCLLGCWFTVQYMCANAELLLLSNVIFIVYSISFYPSEFVCVITVYIVREREAMIIRTVRTTLSFIFVFLFLGCSNFHIVSPNPDLIPVFSQDNIYPNAWNPEEAVSNFLSSQGVNCVLLQTSCSRLNRPAGLCISRNSDWNPPKCVKHEQHVLIIFLTRKSATALWMLKKNGFRWTHSMPFYIELLKCSLWSCDNEQRCINQAPGLWAHTETPLNTKLPELIWPLDHISFSVSISNKQSSSLLNGLN